ncbi:hypothetical protein BMH32_08055 [Leucobacter sp. OLJS4]|uniref:C45 family autoproteolytic acyltransferase/hydolase n=1 Tax=unclassified Leucobacter TaxID=2621730 RepID=UPI000C185425|nr:MULTISPECIES: C45 family peptidase [unclassified Leucobacter]PII86670.1 hypothetical protein BMH25_01155 [Leucobacter sp. OLCALW19]PII88963.1 hypothetical protein BMH27_15105 [Leucobacter sp. OLAS13]PII96052.1 hypothetical protein BMH26_00875 [Leucobacter sp. OLTLW20]PII99326.1 hypothetical protein BMH29_05320 [Leucobacter sp. OLDS2]PIJ01712.1 hypothetical protein BMH28_06150 [Leucobacter sp. OLCS4]
MQIRTAEIEGHGPEQRGAEIGTRFGAEIRDTVARYLEFFALSGLSRARVDGIAERSLAALRAWAPGLAQEIEATAAAGGVPTLELAALNARTEILAAGEPDREGECSTLVLAPESARSPLTLQTWDWHADLCPTGLLLSVAPDPPEAERGRGRGRVGRVGRVRLFTEAGMLGKIGVNDAGLGVHFNILHHASDTDAGGVPVHAIARRVLDEASTVEEAASIIRSAPVSASTVLTVVADRGARRAVCFEISPERVAEVLPDPDGVLVHTNHFLAPELAAGEAASAASTTRTRFAHLSRIGGLGDLRGAGASIEERAADFCGPEGAHAPVCMRPDPSLPPHDQWTTLLTIGLDLERGRLEYRAGSPAELVARGAERFGD